MNSSNDSFLHELRSAPPPAFADGLREQLKQQDQVDSNYRQPLLRAASIAAVFLSVTVLLTVPGARTMAQQFLELFRAKNFVAVSINTDRFSPDRLKGLTKGVDLPHLIGDQVSLLTPPAITNTYATENDAALITGFAVAVPHHPESNLVISEVKVMGAETWQITPDTSKLQQLLNMLELDDLHIPTGLDGQQLTWTKPTMVQLTYLASGDKVSVLQMPIPKIELPGNVDLAVFGEIGLRIFGLSAADAHEFASKIDWRTTFVVPIPPEAASFQQINVQGHNGLLIESRPEVRSRMGAVLIWSDDQFVHVVRGTYENSHLLDIANSLQ